MNFNRLLSFFTISFFCAFLVSCTSSDDAQTGAEPVSLQITDWTPSLVAGLDTINISEQHNEELLRSSEKYQELQARKQALNERLYSLREQILEQQANIEEARRPLNELASEQARCTQLNSNFRTLRSELGMPELEEMGWVELTYETIRTGNFIDELIDETQGRMSRHLRDYFHNHFLPNNPFLASLHHDLNRQREVLSAILRERAENLPDQAEVCGELERSQESLEELIPNLAYVVETFESDENADRETIRSIYPRTAELVFPLIDEFLDSDEVYELRSWVSIQWNGNPSDLEVAQYLLQQKISRKAEVDQELITCNQPWTDHIYSSHPIDRGIRAIGHMSSEEARRTPEFISMQQEIERFEALKSLVYEARVEFRNCGALDVNISDVSPEHIRRLRHTVQLIDRLSQMIVEVGSHMANLEGLAREIVEIKIDLLAEPVSNKTYNKALRALVLTHKLQNDSHLERSYEFLQNMIEGHLSSEIFDLKESYEARIADELWSGQTSVYNRNAANFFDLVSENRSQCYSGSLHFINALLNSKDQRSMPLERVVLIFTAGHVLPGVIHEKDQDLHLTGIEMTAAGKALIEFGSTRNVGGPMRIISLMDFLMIEVFKAELPDSILTVEDTERFLNYYNFNKNQFISPEGVATTSNSDSLLNSSPLGFGQSSVPLGDIERQVIETSVASSQYIINSTDEAETELPEPPIIIPNNPYQHLSFNGEFMTNLQMILGDQNANFSFDCENQEVRTAPNNSFILEVQCRVTNGILNLSTDIDEFSPSHCSAEQNEIFQSHVFQLNEAREGEPNFITQLALEFSEHRELIHTNNAPILQLRADLLCSPDSMSVVF